MKNIDPHLFNLVSEVGQSLKRYDHNTIDKGTNGQAFKLDLSKVVKSGGEFSPQIDPTINMPDPAGNYGYDENIPIPTNYIPIPAPTTQNDSQLELPFGQITIDQIFNKLDSIETLLLKIYKKLPTNG
jgi:hypothetical protein